MKKILKVIGAILVIVLSLYLISNPIIKAKNPVKESMFFTPTKYNGKEIFNQLDAKYLTNISKDSILLTANKFIKSKTEDSCRLNQTVITRDFEKFNGESNSEYYTISPSNSKKTAIFMMGNQFNIFNLLDNLTEFAKKDSVKIYVVNYSGNGYSEGKSNFESQFKINQKFYNFIRSKQNVDDIFGHSLGTVFATKLAVDNKIPNLILFAPASNINDIEEYALENAPFWIKPYANFDEIENSEISTLGNTSENNKKYYGRLILSHGTKDLNLPYPMSEKIFRNCPSKNKRLLTIKNGDHYAPFVGNNWKEIVDLIK